MIGARVLVPGRAGGAPLKLSEPLSFWGGFDSGDGCVIDRFHPQNGICLTDRILFVERGRGSSSGASVLAEAIRAGTAPAGICLVQADAIIATGAMVAAMLYAKACPVVAIADRTQWEALAAKERIVIDARDREFARFL